MASAAAGASPSAGAMRPKPSSTSCGVQKGWLRSGSASALIGAGSYGTGALASTVVAAVSDGSPTAFAAVMLFCLGGSSTALFVLALRRPA